MRTVGPDRTEVRKSTHQTATVTTLRAVLLYLIALLAAVIVVPITGGDYRRLDEIALVRWGLLFAGLGIQIAMEFLDFPEARWTDAGLALLLLSYVCILGFCVSNLRTSGMGVIAIGIALNAFVIAINQGMPYESPKGVGFHASVKHRPLEPSDRFTVLADTIPLGGPFHASISFGDLVIAVGLVEVAYRNSRQPRRARTSTPEDGDNPEADSNAYELWLRESGNAVVNYNSLESVDEPGVIDKSRS